ncbi:glycerophosphodiester phosphodiesterase domain-containing protein 4 [Mauremys reevesii]|uniref:glycerophosphodiester phosphodiesterase domain-containing protein 4 n=1 Tax=Mauremys reevesii TaxID=260615 RepID=UPI00193FBCE8|nr:glycerophosphodiester phosphodiesterase domain-containing protein 4 [Mauremys reevesii]XP_039393658.1 glycerophosphodiester phosphodiesterase domain-containing protein 4 [Mauremys reevesii]XP_039393664.1 glycerophosphodiester phosphodiesterase domain-containing protein 4 [Mauremys reevesii]XP_039393667.1 glycerophosphodiester phosphodiesterase domain-containing protein 4 [Mauremys reevesii]XP_039393674.1 glycerophosphodiester phosphodiesterase domain-containing protein 4 [Mauremys reevesii]
MDSSSVSLKKLKFGKLKVVRRHLLQRYEHQPFISCLAGLYSCRWKRYQRRRTEPGQCCCKMWECVFFPFLVGAFCLSLVFLYMWGEAKNDYNNFDWYNYGNIGHWFLWSVLLLILAAVLFTYITLLLVLAVCLLSEGQQLYLHWSHKIGTFLVLGFSIAGISVFSKLWRVRWKTVRLSLQVTAPYLHIGAIAAMVLLSWPVALHAFRTHKKVIQAIIIGPYLAILVLLFLIPLGMYSPCIREVGTLGPKPALIGHRGAPMLAPENTEMSFQKTIDHGGDGLETDVTISYDGIPFLMHDSNLQRTTNIREVFPSNSTQNAALFSWDALEQLNAGKWFLKDTPFSCMGSLSSADQKLAMNQSIYKLSNFLRLADSANKLVIFDLYRPPEKHPYRNTWINITLEVIRDSGINPHLVLWLDNTMRSFVQAVAPGFQHTMASKAPVDQLLRDNIVKLNLVYSTMSSEDIRKYAQANITTNLYVISEPWLFSLAWCVGVHSVTTNAVQFLKDINRPLFLMTPKEYRIMWLLTDVVAALLISLIFALHWWREKGFSCCSDDSGVVLENGTYNKFRTELNDLPTVVA